MASTNIKKNHNKLLVDISDKIDIKSRSYQNFLRMLRNDPLPAGRLQQVRDDPLEVFHLMEERGILKEGYYKELEKALEASSIIDVLDLVKNVGSEIEKQMNELNPTTIPTASTRSVGSRSSSRRKVMVATQGISAESDCPSFGKPGTSVASHGSCNKKRKVEFTEVGESSKDVYEVYDRKDGKGLLLILNFTARRVAIKESSTAADGSASNKKKTSGKPKVFLIDACQGHYAQKGHDIANDWSEDISDVAEKVSVPTDADVLIAFATTPGYVAYSRTNVGSWFTHVTTNVFEERHKYDHVEEMFIKVKNDIAKDEKWRTENNELMMPCTWSTLTQKLMI